MSETDVPESSGCMALLNALSVVSTNDIPEAVNRKSLALLSFVSGLRSSQPNDSNSLYTTVMNDASTPSSVAILLIRSPLGWSYSSPSIAQCTEVIFFCDRKVFVCSLRTR